MTSARPWSELVGFGPHKVKVYENVDKGAKLYLQWRAGGNWRRHSLGYGVRDKRGRIDRERQGAALAAARVQYEVLAGVRPSVRGRAAPLTIGESWPVLSARNGLYFAVTPHAKEVARALRAAERILGAQLPWDLIDRSHLRMLGRTRIDELRAKGLAGYRSAELTVQRVLTAAAWLRDEGKIARDACLPPRRWREDLRNYWSQVTDLPAPEPAQPRHTLDDLRKLFAVASSVDPRFELLLALGAELRLGQVARARRSDIDEENCTLTIRGRRSKKGTIVALTDGQLASWLAAKGAGYLAPLEVLADYPPFPRGQLPGGRTGKGVAAVERHGYAKPICRTTIRKWFAQAEHAAGIPHVRGRGAYGLRRVAVDSAKELHISREGLKSFGGWTHTQVPDFVYADQDAEYARLEAANIRAKMRGEL